MGNSRTHISVSKRTYDEAKHVVEQFNTLGRSITMEDALYLAKKEREERRKQSGGGVWGF